eukprot:1414771-Amphidinium_carterae.1
MDPGGGRRQERPERPTKVDTGTCGRPSYNTSQTGSFAKRALLAGNFSHKDFTQSELILMKCKLCLKLLWMMREHNIDCDDNGNYDWKK